MRKTLNIIMFFFIWLSVSAQTKNEYQLILKVKSDYSEKCLKSKILIPEIESILNDVMSVNKKFPLKSKLKNKQKGLVDLSTIYEITFDNQTELKKHLHLLKKSLVLEYVEEKKEDFLVFEPNDSLRTQQYYLNAIQAFDAWDIDQGDTSITIGIVDTGTDLDHPDLINNLAINHSDPINGIDDDNDGYTDNYYGWNVASDNNNVSFLGSGHGTNVAGIACAEANNQFGIAGVGFKTHFLTVRSDLPNGRLRNTYEGIVYAADHGADVINCSWGSSFYSQYAQDIINYATYNKGALVVAATGNNGHEFKFYPAAYDNVLSVGSTVEGDTVKSTSNFGDWVNIMAPGDAMLTCNVIGGFGSNGGTSMAAPVVSACAAIVKSHFPNYNAQQIAQKLITTADNIDHLAPANYAEKLGTGRVNLFRALSETNSPGIEFINRQIIGSNDFFRSNDTLKISGDFINYLASTSNASATLSTDNSAVSIIKNQIQLGALNTLDTLNNQTDPFLVIIGNSTEFNNIIKFKLSINDANYSAKQYFEVTINKDYITLSENLLTATYSSSGAIGFSGLSNELGDGISFKSNTTLLYEGSFAVGNSEFYLLDKFRNNNSGFDNDFKIVSSINQITPEKANVELRAIFNDANFSNPQGLEIVQWNYLFRSGSGENSIIYVYSLRNNGIAELRNLYAGIFMDWDINIASKNKIFYDSTRSLGISYATDTNLFCGITQLNSSLKSNHYAIDNTISGDGLINAYDGLTDLEKIDALSNQRDSAGTGSLEGNDVIDVVSAGPFNLKVDSTISVGFAISITDSLSALYQESDSVKILFDRLALGIVDHERQLQASENSSIFPNPAHNKINVRFYLSESEQLKIQIFDLKGQLIFDQKEQRFGQGINELEVNTSSLKSGLYFLRVIGDNLNIEDKFVVSGN